MLVLALNCIRTLHWMHLLTINTLRQVKEMEKSSDNGSSSLLASAIAGKSATVFEAAVSLIVEDLKPEEVREAIRKSSRYGDPILPTNRQKCHVE